eukprot:Clim_evm49s251 gene=Clim_evmTU49s251
MRVFNFCAALLAALTIGSCAQSYKIEMKCLLISFNGYKLPVQDTMDHMNLRYDIMVAGGSMPLEIEEGYGAYSCIVVDGNPALGEFRAELDTYRLKYGVRAVYLNGGDDQLTFTVNNVAPNNARVTDIARSKYAVDRILRNDRALDLGPLELLPRSINKEAVNGADATVEPLLVDAENNNAMVAEVIEKYGLKNLYLHVRTADWTTEYKVLIHFVIDWVTEGTFSGFRRMSILPQIDDFFLPNRIWNTKTNYRVSAEDVDWHLKWQRDFNSRLPADSTVMLDFAYNANGVFYYDSSLSPLMDTAERRYVARYPTDVRNALGNGTDYWYRVDFNNDFSQNQTLIESWQREDPLFNYVSRDEVKSNFLWTSHTFSHSKLSSMSYQDVRVELWYNDVFAKALGVHDTWNFSGRSLVTPMISGMYNANLYKVMEEMGIMCHVCDVTKYDWCNSRKIVRINEAEQGYNGRYSLPRYATEIYFHSSTPEENMNYFNSRGRDWSFDQLLQFEADRAAPQILDLNIDPYMFHQINMRQYVHSNGTEGSLVSDWLEAVTEQITVNSAMPITSLRQDDIFQLLWAQDRSSRCDYSLKMIRHEASHRLLGVEFDGDNGCAVIFTVPTTALKNSVMPDSGTLWPMAPYGNDMTYVVLSTGKPMSFSFPSSPTSEEAAKERQEEAERERQEEEERQRLEEEARQREQEERERGDEEAKEQERLRQEEEQRQREEEEQIEEDQRNRGPLDEVAEEDNPIPGSTGENDANNGDGDDSSGSTMNIAIIIAVVAGVAVLLVIVLVFFYIRHRKRSLAARKAAANESIGTRSSGRSTLSRSSSDTSVGAAGPAEDVSSEVTGYRGSLQRMNPNAYYAPSSEALV